MNFLVQIQSKSNPSQTPEMILVSDFQLADFVSQYSNEDIVLIFTKIKTFYPNEWSKEEKMA